MRKVSSLAIVLMSLAMTIAQPASAPAHNPSAKTSARRPTHRSIARGKYIVNQLVMCGDCHSPRDQKGQFVRARWLGGSPMFVKPVFPIPGWAQVAPAIAGLPGWSDSATIKLLTTGLTPDGNPPGPPMPQFHMTYADAASVVAYLKSLKPIPPENVIRPLPKPH